LTKPDVLIMSVTPCPLRSGPFAQALYR